MFPGSACLMAQHKMGEYIYCDVITCHAAIVCVMGTIAMAVLFLKWGDPVNEAANETVSCCVAHVHVYQTFSFIANLVLLQNLLFLATYN